MPTPVPWRSRLLYSLAPTIALIALPKSLDIFFGKVLVLTFASGQSSSDAQAAWYAPKKSQINSLESALTGPGVYGFVFNSSTNPPETSYATLNYCNAPHARKAEYERLPSDFKLRYVEVVQRHHIRTPYSSNLFPNDDAVWNCDEIASFWYATRLSPGNNFARTYTRLEDFSLNPFSPAGNAKSSCSFPQLTKAGLDDSWQYGRDIYDVYHNRLGPIPDDALADGAVQFRITKNPITCQVAGMIVGGMFGLNPEYPVPLRVQPAQIDSLEPKFACPAAERLKRVFGVGNTNAAWTLHLKKSRGLFYALDTASGVSASSEEWYNSWDHYCDNLSSRTYHNMPLPPNISLSQAAAVFRIGMYGYGFLYRDLRQSLQIAKSEFGVWLTELADHLALVSQGEEEGVVYRDNVAHDGSVAMLLSLLQIDVMVWPALASEVVFELYEHTAEAAADENKVVNWYLRVLWGGRVLSSSHRILGRWSVCPWRLFFRIYRAWWDHAPQEFQDYAGTLTSGTRRFFGDIEPRYF